MSEAEASGRGPLRRALAGLCLLLLIAAGTAVPQPAAATPEVRAFVDGIGTAAARLLREGPADAAERREVVQRLLHDSIDIAALARLSLGRFWRLATPEQQREFEGLFEAFLVNLCTNGLEPSAAEPPAITGFAIERVRAEPDARYAVLTHFHRPAGLPFRVEWRVDGEGEGLRVVDVAFEGISMVVLFRQMMANAVQEGGGDVEGLLTRLRGMVGFAGAVALPALRIGD